MTHHETSDEYAARVQRAAGRESDAERRYRESRETDAAIQAAQATPDDDAAHHVATLRYVAECLGTSKWLPVPAQRNAIRAAAAWIERQS